MSAAELLEHAKAEGILLVLDGERLNWMADHQPPAELLTEIKAYRLEIIALLNMANESPEALVWLAGVAGLLGCSSDYLLVHGFVDRHDLAEQHQHPPQFAARLIRSHPDWHQPGKFGEQCAHMREGAREQCEPRLAAASISPEWIAARDAFHRHALGGCPHCYPPLGRYCATGADLRARLDLKALNATEPEVELRYGETTAQTMAHIVTNP